MALRNTPLRFECLVAVCLTAPPLAVAALGAHAFNGWRHLYFLHAPLCLLAASGLRLLTPADAAWARRGTYAAAGVAAAGILIAMARIHPFQNVYFNFLVDRTTPEHLQTQYEMDYWETARLGALRHLAQTYPSISLCAPGGPWRQQLPEAQRKRTSHCLGRRADFNVGVGMFPPRKYFAPKVWVRKVYGNTIASVYGVNLALLDDSHVELHLDRFRETYRIVTQDAPAARAHYDVYFNAARGALTYARAPCVPADQRAPFFLHVVPADAGDLPDHRVQYGFDNRDFDLPPQTLFDGKCLAAVRLPEYDIDHVRTGQFTRRRTKEGIRFDNVWEDSFSPGDLDGSGRT